MTIHQIFEGLIRPLVSMSMTPYFFIRYTPLHDMQQLSKPMISVVLPAYNEGEFIEKALKSLESVVKDQYPYEVIVINDGSDDDTGPKILKYASGNGHVQVVNYGTNVGKGYAVKKGFLRAHGDAVVFVDIQTREDVLFDDKAYRESITQFETKIRRADELFSQIRELIDSRVISMREFK